jgi:membrane protein HdeD
MSIAAGLQPSTESKTPLKIAAVITIILGVLALVMPFLAGIAATYILAANFVIAGVLMVAAAFNARGWAGSLGLMILGMVSVIAGVVVFAHPLIGLATVALFSIAGMFVAGIARISWAFKLPSGGGRWSLIISGVLSILVAAMLFSEFPFSARWLFGVLVGVNLLMEGTSMWVFSRGQS